MQSTGKNKINWEANDYGVGDLVISTFATTDDETARRPVMALAGETNKIYIGARLTKASDQ